VRRAHDLHHTFVVVGVAVEFRRAVGICGALVRAVLNIVEDNALTALAVIIALTGCANRFNIGKAQEDQVGSKAGCADAFPPFGTLLKAFRSTDAPSGGGHAEAGNAIVVCVARAPEGQGRLVARIHEIGSRPNLEQVEAEKVLNRGVDNIIRAEIRFTSRVLGRVVRDLSDRNGLYASASATGADEEKR